MKGNELLSGMVRSTLQSYSGSAAYIANDGRLERRSI
jgi:hypothetical protein